MLYQSILPLLTLLFSGVGSSHASSVSGNSIAPRMDPGAPPLCLVRAGWTMIGSKPGKDYEWHDIVKMDVWIKNDTNAGWSGWPQDAVGLLNNFIMDRDNKMWLSLTDGIADQPQKCNRACNGREENQCFTEIEGRPQLRASPQHGKRDDGWTDKNAKQPASGVRWKMRDYIQFYWGPPKDVRLAWHTDDNGNPHDMFIIDQQKRPFCRLWRDDPAKGISWQYWYNSNIQVYVNENTRPEWGVAEGWDVECLFECPP
ncbi:hypothetical protein TWF730_011278 [Orbilia blumenaviensis]|uniref:Uncharacterized protein n=1 Tax=Orbilia blumenaviensis TaxID=1796055 RepID=A0AAV9UJZ9_9PEZI